MEEERYFIVGGNMLISKLLDLDKDTAVVIVENNLLVQIKFEF